MSIQKKSLIWMVSIIIFMFVTKAECAFFNVVSDCGELQISENGVSLSPSIKDCPASVATGENWWAVILETAPGEAAGGDICLYSQDQKMPRIKKKGSGCVLTYEGLSDGRNLYEIELQLLVQGENKTFQISGEISNRTRNWVVKGFTGPVFNGIRTDLKKTPLLLPDGMGRRINGVPVTGNGENPWRKTGQDLRVEAHYPGARGTMQWFAYAGDSAGIYFGCHDPRFGAKTLSARYDPQRKTFGAAFQPRFFALPGERYQLPLMVIMPYEGDWHVAARTYRAWADRSGEFYERPEWAANATGWLLAILKQQNGDIMWPYDSLGKLAEVAEERGLDILGLFGWGYGGHDHLYPDYNPCPLMGGEDALRKGIKDVHDRGKRVVLYANGQLQERGTAYWTSTGRYLAVKHRDGRTVQEFWHKYGNTPGYHFDLGCHATKGWRERMLSLAMQANDFGADGILYDQLGMRNPMACYAANHGHDVPAMCYEGDRKEMLLRIAEKMQKVNPEFVVMTEGFHDSVMDSISYFHGCIPGCFADTAGRIAGRTKEKPTDDLFPEMLRYTYPEVALTVRYPSPLMDRSMVNYTCTYGWRYEIESRYIPDRDYLQDKKIPETEDYSAVRSKPNIAYMQKLPFDETASYLKTVAEFQKKHAELLMTGKFSDTEGFTLEGEGVVAKRFSSADSIGIMLWNTMDKPAAFKLLVPDAQVVSAEEPGKGVVPPFGELAPESLRLVLCKNKGIR